MRGVSAVYGVCSHHGICLGHDAQERTRRNDGGRAPVGYAYRCSTHSLATSAFISHFCAVATADKRAGVVPWSSAPLPAQAPGCAEGALEDAASDEPSAAAKADAVEAGTARPSTVGAAVVDCKTNSLTKIGPVPWELGSFRPSADADPDVFPTAALK